MGKNEFEDELMDRLEGMVGDQGVPMLQRQSWSQRRGNFQMEQKADILLDSPKNEYYLAFEAKDAKADSNTPKFYFSAKYNEDQIRKQIEYRDRSGRDFYVAIRVVNHNGEDYDLLFPIDYFIEWLDAGEKGIEWGILVNDGVEFEELTLDVLQEAENVSADP